LSILIYHLIIDSLLAISYLIDGKTWEDDSMADRYDPAPFGACENSVVIV